MAPTDLKQGVAFGEKRPVSIIGNDLTILGEQITIVTQGTLQLDGEVSADLYGAEIIVGEQGRVRGTVSAEHVTVKGHVEGTIRGVRVELLPQASVEGEIHNQTLVISEGAHFDGRVRRPSDVSELKPVLDPRQLAQRQAEAAAGASRAPIIPLSNGAAA
jgi:cytoskeletal protein CcmA (bactofilin family)